MLLHVLLDTAAISLLTEILEGAYLSWKTIVYQTLSDVSAWNY